MKRKMLLMAVMMAGLMPALLVAAGPRLVHYQARIVGAPDSAVGGLFFTPAAVSNVTAAGCTVNFASINGAAATGSSSFDWLAVGERGQ